MSSRPDWDTYFLSICAVVATRADCTRRQVGAVIVKNHRITATGYNGVRSGERGCLEGACTRGQHAPDKESRKWQGGMPGIALMSEPRLCICGLAWPCPYFVDHGSSYDTGAGSCIAIHAEMNAIMYSSREDRDGATMYITDYPCDGCYRLIRGSGILRIVTPERNEQWHRTELHH